jgi:hypothetical protein
MSAQRFNVGKLRWNLIWWPAIQIMGWVLEMGALKYSPDNWKKGLNREEILESMQRHLVALFGGQETDPESKIHHMGHIMCNAMFYLYHHMNNSFTKQRNNPFTSKTIKNK